MHVNEKGSGGYKGNSSSREGDPNTAEPVLLHTIRQGTFDAVRQVYAIQPETRKRADIELDT